MKPRVEIVAVPKSMSVASVLGVVRESGYSRIPGGMYLQQWGIISMIFIIIIFLSL